MKPVPIPKRMAHLEKDDRGYPIPVMIFRDSHDQPHFTINGEGTRFVLFVDDCCSICGQKLLKNRCFIGGPVSAFHPDGVYHDPPIHRDCAHYALQVCPWLALASYTKPIGHRTIDGRGLRFIDATQDPTKPKVFVCVTANGQQNHFNQRSGLISVKPNRPYVGVDFWKDGQRLSQAAGLELACSSGVDPRPHLHRR